MTRPQILVVEDERLIAWDLQQTLEDMGYSVPNTVATGQDAIEKADENRPDLVLMDIMLEGEIDGIEAAREIRARFAIPVVYLTAYATEEILERAKDTDPYGYLIKPFQKKELRATIEMALSKHETQRRIREGETRYRRLVELTPDGIIVHADGNILFVNPAGAKMLGASSPEELIGRSVLDFIHLDCHKKAIERMRQAELEGQPLPFSEQKLVRLDGNIFDAEVAGVQSSYKNKPAVQTIIRDIGDRKGREEALRRSEQRFRELADLLPQTVFELDREGRLTFANRKAFETFGYSERDFERTLSVLDMVAAEDLCTIKDNVLSVCSGGAHFVQEFMALRKDGARFPILCHVAPIGQGTTVEGFRGVVLDLTEQKRTEQAVLESERLRAVGELAAGVAHNFNNLLQAVMGGAQLAAINLERGDIAAVRDQLDQIQQSVRFGAETVKRLQGFARRRSDPSSGPSVLDLSDTVARAIEISRIWWQTNAERKGIRISMLQALNPGSKVNGKENELLEVVVNLIKNAAEAMPEGGQIRVDTSVRGNQVVLSVSDTGVGVLPEHLEKLFDPFFTTKGPQSTGMGLASVHMIVSGHGGRVFVDSQVRKGATFTVELPFVTAVPEVTAARLEKPLEGALRILVVEDNASVRDSVRDGLIRYGHEVLAVSSGLDALRLLGETKVDLVISDLGMPGMSGWEMARKARALAEERNAGKIPFILLTGWGLNGEEEEKMLRSGVDKVLEKPVDIAKLLDTARELI